MNVKRWSCAVAACLVLTAATAGAQIRVGSVVNARGGGGWSLDGSNMTTTRAKLLNPANFGATGTANKSITITDTASASGSIDAALLANFDVFFIGYFPTTTFTAGELTAMQTWVSGGGTLIATCDDPGHADFCIAFGHTPSNSATPPVTPTAAGSSTVFGGPFGNVASIVMQFTEGFFPTASGATVLGVDSSGLANPIVLLQTSGSGRALFLSDVDMISIASLSGGAGITNGNDRFLGNLFAFAGAASGNAAFASPVPIDPRLAVLLVAALGLLAWGRLRRG